MSSPLGVVCGVPSGGHYAVLGVRRDADEAEISRAYKALALRHHPDKNQGNTEAEVHFKRIAEAYEVLKDPAKRRSYDFTGTASPFANYEEAERNWRAFHSQGAEVPRGAGAGPSATPTRRKAVPLIVALVVLLVAHRAVLATVAGATAGFAGAALLTGSGRRNISTRARYFIVLLVAAYVTLRAIRVSVSAPSLRLPAASESDPAIPSLPGAEQDAGKVAAPTALPRSGEELLLADGTFVRAADATAMGASRPPAEDWRRRLWSAAFSAARRGEEQVVMVFSRDGCPWCERQIPVLRRAILRRRVALGEADDADARRRHADVNGTSPDASAALGSGPGRPRLRGAAAPGFGKAIPLRVFVFDADELPHMADTFQVEAFPTIVVWGPPGEMPRKAQGFLDDLDFEGILRAAAGAASGDTGAGT